MNMKLFRLGCFQPFVQILDVIFSSVVVGPLVIAYWVSVWKFCDIFIASNDDKLSAAISFAFGFGGQFLLMLFQAPIGNLLKFKKHKFIKLLVSRAYAFLFALTNINLWRAAWMFADYISTTDTIATLLNVARNLTIVMLTKTLKNSISTPFVVATDGSNDDYKVATYFGRNVSTRASCSLNRLTKTFL